MKEEEKSLRGPAHTQGKQAAQIRQRRDREEIFVFLMTLNNPQDDRKTEEI